MSATILNPPRSLSLSEDDNHLMLTTDLVSFSPAVVRLNCGDTAAPANGNEFSMEWDSNILTFTFATDPDDSGNQLPLRSGGESDVDYRARLEESFRQNELLTRYWRIVNSSANNVLRFRYRVSAPLAVTVSSDATGMAAIQESAGAFSSDEDNLRAVIQLFGGNSNDDAIVTLEADYETISPYRAIFNLKSLAEVAAYLPPANTMAATVPMVNDYAVTAATGAYQALYFRYADKYGTPPVAEALKKGSTFYVIYGGSAGDSRRIFGSTGGRWLCHSYYDAQGVRFRKPITLDQPDYLFLWNNANPITVGIQLVVTYSDGTTNSLPVSGSGTVALAANTLYCFPAGPAQMAITDAPDYANKTAVAYDIRITNSTYAVTLFRVEYDLVLNCPPWQIVLAYANGLGAIETVSLTGKSSYDYEAEREIFERSTSIESNTTDGVNIPYDQRGLQSWQANSAPISRAYAQHLRQLLLGETWLVDKQNMRYLRVQVTDTRMGEKDDEDLYSISVTFKLSTPDKSYHKL